MHETRGTTMMAVEVRSTSSITNPAVRVRRDAGVCSGAERQDQVRWSLQLPGRRWIDDVLSACVGNAIDILCDEDDLQAIANNVVLQATKQTKANDGVMVPSAGDPSSGSVDA
jgi:hypothetical protein